VSLIERSGQTQTWAEAVETLDSLPLLAFSSLSWERLFCQTKLEKNAAFITWRRFLIYRKINAL